MVALELYLVYLAKGKPSHFFEIGLLFGDFTRNTGFLLCWTRPNIIENATQPTFSPISIFFGEYLMHQLLPAGQHLVRVVGIRQDSAYMYLSFASEDERTAIQRMPNATVTVGLTEMACQLKDLHGRSCVIRVESVLAEPGVMMARAIDCQWLPVESPSTQQPRTLA